jgi:hypothetical protein
MNCDEFLPALETGGPLRRRLARRHAAGCPRCAAVAARLAAVKRQWADTPPLGPQERMLWEGAAVGDPGIRNLSLPAPRRPLSIPYARHGWHAWAAAACVLLVVSLVVSLVVRHQGVNVAIGPQPQPPPTKTTRTTSQTSQPPSLGPVRVEAVDGLGELENLATAVDRLDVQMQELRRNAERAEARTQVASALDRFGHW